MAPMKVLHRTENVLSQIKWLPSHAVGASQYLGTNFESFMDIAIKRRVAGTPSSFMYGDCEGTRGYMTLGSERHTASTEARSSSAINS